VHFSAQNVLHKHSRNTQSELPKVGVWYVSPHGMDKIENGRSTLLCARQYMEKKRSEIGLKYQRNRNEKIARTCTPTASLARFSN